MKRFDLTARGWPLFLILFVLHGLVALRTGPQFSSDSATYLRWAGQVSANGLSYAPVLGAEGATSPRLFRALFVYYLVVVRAAGGSHWPMVFLLLNAVWEALAGMMLIRLVRRTTGQAGAALATLIAYALAYEIVAWTPFILSDTVYLASTMAAFVLMCRVATKAPSWSDLAWLALAVFLAMNLRPTAIILIPVALTAVFTGWRTQGRIPRFSAAAITVVAVTAILGCGLLFLAEGWILQKPSRWPVSFMAKPVHLYSTEFGRGQVIRDRPETYHAPPESVAGYAAISADRLVRFFQFTSSGFSRRHNVMSTAFFVPLYLLALIGAIAGLRSESAVRVVVVLALLWIAAHAVVHALTELDFDWRYRMPVIPQLILLAGVGVGVLLGSRAQRLGQAGFAAQGARD